MCYEEILRGWWELIYTSNTGRPRYMQETGTKKNRVAYNEFAYKKTKDTYKLGDRLTYAKSQIKRQHIMRCQFHQHFTYGLFVQKAWAKLFCAYILVLNFFGARLLAQMPSKMLAKLTANPPVIYSP